MSAETLERSVLEGKDREQLMAIASALGIKSVSRAKKADLIGKILEQTGVGDAASSPVPAGSSAPVNGSTSVNDRDARHGAVVGGSDETSGSAATAGSAPTADPTAAAEPGTENAGASRDAASAPTEAHPQAEAPAAGTGSQAATSEAADQVLVGPDGEPLAEWEIALRAEQGAQAAPESAESSGSAREGGAEGDGDGEDGQTEGDGEGNRRRRRRRRGRNRGDEAQASGVADQSARFQDRPREGQRDRSERDEERPVQAEPIKVSGYLDLRDEGYGFLRVNGFLPSREDAYVSVKQTRQHGLRKGDHVTGIMRPAGRNEKNAALLEVHTVNGGDPEKAKNRPRFEDLTPLFPDEKLKLENPADPSNMTARIVDLISPIGKGQRGLIVSPPKAGKTTIMKTIATSIERNNPEVKLIVLLIDERPEEVTDMRRTVQGEVIASTFDRPSDEHTHLAELAIERAKRMVEVGDDVVIILDGITRLSRAYNLAAPATGRIMSGGIDAGALYPPKKFFGAARNIEEGGSLTILATALVETNSRMDDAIFEEFKGTGNMELRLDRKLAERRIFPAIDVDASSTRHEELLFDRKQLQLVWKLRRVLSGLAADGNAAPGLELLIDRLKTFRTNDEFLNEIAKQPSM